ncbi:TPA_asm: RNA-directed RNA polymerase [ssRNA phage SRR7976299_15]|uniref:RNA-directed RNA polymerase n=1 Tax=ssRNA phage SRR7976299_15 TaxID=2786637 RepID=A0A8S5L4M2_9VIRU|nr:RNA-directed RNA polymerase [ssRNA phage SRR7976299_15]DAD52654.1 TPA_asm: RNA-directed RNA polymerase [ssRNA phage SRR7976299_15]
MTHKKRSRNAISFTKFRQMHLATLRYLVNLYSLNETVSLDARIAAYALLAALSCGRFADAVEISDNIQSQQYKDAEAHRLGYQIAFLVKKVPWKDPELDPEGAARKKFWESEEKCKETNTNLRPIYALLNGHVGTTYHESAFHPSFYLRATGKGYEVVDDGKRLIQLLCRARNHVRRVLGNSPDLKTLYGMARFSNGSAIGATGNATHFLRKMGNETWSVTPSALFHATNAFFGIPAFHRGLHPFEEHQIIGDPSLCFKKFEAELKSRSKVVEHDKINYVTKVAKVHRTVGTPVFQNILLQNGVGDWIRERLRLRANIDITTAQEKVNGPLAYLGSSCEGHPFATLDLTAASDTIAIQFVKLLLPPEWFAFLDQIRSPGFTLDGESYRSEKFMAMGNGFCFPLETLLFWSLVQAVYEDCEIPDARCAVYGDDIIVYQSAALELIELLNVCGFELNNEKSFVFGPFRESCGQDYFNGLNVRPFVCDFVIADYGQAFHFINSLRAKGYTNLAQELTDNFIPHDWTLYRPALCGGPSNTALDSSRTPAQLGLKFNEDLHCWEWNELLTNPVMDERQYGRSNRYQMGAALQGAAPDENGMPAFALRRETRTFVRRVAHG